MLQRCGTMPIMTEEKVVFEFVLLVVSASDTVMVSASLAMELQRTAGRKQGRRRMNCLSLALEKETQRSRQRACLRR